MAESRTTLTLVDDGAGQILCPRKGAMAIDRCREWQRETAALDPRGACTCSVYHSYAGGEPDRERSLESFPQERVLPIVRCGRSTAITPADLDDGTLEFKSPPTEERHDMATHNSLPNVCRRCGKPGTVKERVTFELHRSCRIEARAEQRSAERRPPQDAAEKPIETAIADSLTLPPKDETAGAKTIDQVAARHAAGGVPGARQQTIPVIAMQELEQLRSELAAREREIDRLREKLGRARWYVVGLRNGYTKLEALPPDVLD